MRKILLNFTEFFKIVKIYLTTGLNYTCTHFVHRQALVVLRIFRCISRTRSAAVWGLHEARARWGGPMWDVAAECGLRPTLLRTT